MVNSEQRSDSEGLEVQINDPKEELLKRFDKLFVLVIGAMLIGFISMLFMVAGIVVDAWRFNSSIYKEIVEQKVVEDVINKNSAEYNEIINKLDAIEKNIPTPFKK